MTNLYDTFHNSFRVQSATTPEQIEEAQRLRYQVYCLENPFEDAAQHHSGRERDEYDARSAHSLVHHHPSGFSAGVVRIVLPDDSDPAQPFPIEAHVGEELDWSLPELRALPRSTTAEISRFAVSKTFKRRIAESSNTAGVSDRATYQDAPDSHDLRRLLPHITLGLFAGIVRMSADHGMTHWYAIMEPTLLRLLTRFGIRFQSIGPLVDYHGKRQPTIGVIDEVLAGIHRERPDVWEIITDRGRVWPAPDAGEDIPARVAATM